MLLEKWHDFQVVPFFLLVRELEIERYPLWLQPISKSCTQYSQSKDMLKGIYSLHILFFFPGMFW